MRAVVHAVSANDKSNALQKRPAMTHRCRLCEVAKVDSAFGPTIQLVYGLSFVIIRPVTNASLIDQGEYHCWFVYYPRTLYLGQLLAFHSVWLADNVFQRGSKSWESIWLGLLSEVEEVVEGSKKTLPTDTESTLDINIVSFLIAKPTIAL